MSKQKVTGPIFFDLVDEAGNELVYGGTTKGYKWTLGGYNNLYIVPGQASDLICSGFAYGQFAPSSRIYFDGNGWVNPTDKPQAVFPITLAAGDACNSYYVMRNGQYLQSTPASTTAVRNAAPVYSSNKYQWLMKQTAGQAFQLQNIDGTYVVASLKNGFSNDPSAANGTIFEWCCHNIVLYNSLDANTGTVNYLSVAANGSVTVASTTSISSLMDANRVGNWNALPQGGFYNGGFFPITSSTSAPTLTMLIGLTGFDATKCARVVEPALLQVDPAKLFIYAAGNMPIFQPASGTTLVTMPYADPTPYTFNMWITCSAKSSKKSSKQIGIIIGASAGGVVLIAAIIVGVLYWQHQKNKKT
jgi:hypothetical protein